MVGLGSPLEAEALFSLCVNKKSTAMPIPKNTRHSLLQVLFNVRKTHHHKQSTAVVSNKTTTAQIHRARSKTSGDVWLGLK